MCHESMSGCSTDLAFEGLRRIPGPGGDGTRLVQTGDISELFVGPTLHVVDEANLTVFNITQEGHVLHKGVVTRSVITDSNGWINIRTTKTGDAGLMGALSGLPAASLWRDVDLRIQRWMYNEASRNR